MIQYRRDIDGLRSLAVVPVVLNHLGLLRGGFVGVDVFFVISGYLITGIIAREIDAERFSLAEFYRRRALRILPALAAVIFAALVAGLFVLVPSEYSDLGVSSVSAAFSVSNVLFWLDTGYFNDAAAFKPLLHTWSLGVEEQFYILFPLLMMAFPRIGPRRRQALLVGIIGVSICLSALQVGFGRPMDAFYLLPGRAWELALGGYLAIAKFSPPPRKWGAAINAVGIGAIIVSVVLYSDRTPFPGLAALLPCLGAVMIIYAGEFGSTPAGSLVLTNGVAVFLGRISYSLYLWHWPVIVFAKLTLDHFGIGQKLALIPLILLLSWVSWKYVEAPFRNLKGVSTPRVLKGSIAAILIIAVFGVVPVVANGFEARYTPQQLAFASALHFDTRAHYGFQRCFLGREHSEQDFDEKYCLAGRSTLLVGDSHSAHLLPGLRYALGDIDQASASGCKPLLGKMDKGAKLCRSVISRVLASPGSLKEYDLIVLAARWNREDVPYLKETAKYLHSRGATVMVVGPVPQYDTALPRLMIAAAQRHDEHYVDRHLLKKIFEVDRSMASELEGLPGVVYMSPLANFCSEERCRTLDGGGNLLAWDYGHLTLEGSRLLAEQAVAILKRGNVTFSRRGAVSSPKVLNDVSPRAD